MVWSEGLISHCPATPALVEVNNGAMCTRPGGDDEPSVNGLSPRRAALETQPPYMCSHGSKVQTRLKMFLKQGFMSCLRSLKCGHRE